MNPLEMTGPDFLGFYLFYGLTLLLVLRLVRRTVRKAQDVEPPALRWRPGVYPREGEAYAIALLRGGPGEVARSALGRLFAEGILALHGRDGRDGRALRLGAPADPVSMQPVESAVLAALASEAGMDGIRAEKRARAAVAACVPPLQRDLEDQGLMPGRAQVRRFLLLRAAALALVPGLGAVKLLVALGRGRTNVGFLLVLIAAFTIAVFFLLRPPSRTLAGDRYLAWLKESHRGLLQLLANGRRESPGETALVAGIYGLQTLPALVPLHTALQPPSTGGDGGSGSGCGSGGGGCGGGCGGCGD